MSTPESNEGQCPLRQPSNPVLQRSEVCEPSGLRRKFLDYCKENPGAEECRLYDV
jgi:hypothetical protein